MQKFTMIIMATSHAQNNWNHGFVAAPFNMSFQFETGLDRKMRYALQFFCLLHEIDTTHSGIAAGSWSSLQHGCFENSAHTQSALQLVSDIPLGSKNVVITTTKLFANFYWSVGSLPWERPQIMSVYCNMDPSQWRSLFEQSIAEIYGEARSRRRVRAL